MCHVWAEGEDQGGQVLCGSVEDNGFLSGVAHSGHTELVSTGLWKGVGEEPVGGPDPVKESPLPPPLDP